MKRLIFFLGLATSSNADSYQVKHIAGVESAAIKGVRFAVGEGFLGRTLIKGNPQFWEDIEKDPRVLFFQRYDVHPRSLFCFPLTVHDGSTVLFFGGGTMSGKLDKKAKELAKTMAIILESSLFTIALQKENTQQLNRLSSLIEICKLMASIPDFKQIIYILVDISLSLVEGPFSCVVLMENQTQKVKLISRGGYSEKVREYARDVIKRYYTETDDHRFTAKTLGNPEQWDHPVIECPLFYKDDLQGILCVGTPDLSEQQLVDHVDFLQTLSVIGGVTLELAKQDDRKVAEDKIFALNKAIRQFDPEAYGIANEAAKLAGGFAKKLTLSLDLMVDIMHACQLSAYSPEFVAENLPDRSVHVLLEEGTALMAQDPSISWEQASKGSQIFALVYSYTKNSGTNLFDNNDELVQQFLRFVETTQLVEEEISLASEILPEKKLVKGTSTITGLQLSPREQEVLDLVIQGYNNREIAEKLFISGHTVKNHVTKIFQKLDVPDRAHAISKVYQLKYKESNE